MDLYNVETYLRPKSLDEVSDWRSNWEWLAGGTWIFNEAQPQVKTLVDMQQLDWSDIEVTPQGLTIGATCIQNDLLDYSFPAAWTATEALKDAVRELASFKLSHAATVGGNLCLALSASTFAPVMVALDAKYEIWRSDANKTERRGEGEERFIESEPYFVDAVDFQTAPQQTILKPGEVLRSIAIPIWNLAQWQTSFKRMAVYTSGYAIAIVVTAYHPQTQRVRFGIGGSVKSPRLIEFARIPTSEEIVEALSSIPSEYLEDERGSAVYRQHITKVLMQRGLEEAIAGINGKRRY